MRKFVLAAALLTAATPICVSAQNASFTSESGDAGFKRLADEFLQGYLRWRPSVGSSLGFHEYDGKVTDYSQLSLDIELGRLKAFDQRLADFDGQGLSRTGFADYRILRNAIKREIFGFNVMRSYWMNPMTYANSIDVSFYIKRDFAPLEDRVRSIISILGEAPRITAAARANLANSLPRPQIEVAIDQANGTADFLAKDLVLALKDVKNEKLMSEFNAVNKRAMDEFRGYATWLKEQKLPQANDHYALGRDRYAELLRYGEMLTQTPEQLLELGLRELKKKQDDFAAAAKEIDPSKPPIQVFEAIQKDHPTAKNLIPDTAKDLEMIRQFVIDHHIVTLPSPVRAKVEETPQFLRATSFASMDTPGPFETKATDAYYYVTPVEPDWPPKQQEEWLTAFNYYTTDIVSVHEAYPGHYVQYLCLKASPATKIEKIFGSYAFIEGWAHYAEQMLVDEGFGMPSAEFSKQERLVTAAKYRLAQADEALLRLCRWCASIKMHCQGMTVDQATKFFVDNCYYEEKPARQEAIRGTFDPEYLYYTVGKLEFFKLREDYRAQEGDKFSLEKFHDEVLRHGAPPLRLLRELMLKDRSSWDKTL